jgi:hypothetical protein
MMRWLKRLFLLAMISGAAFAVWTALQRRDEIGMTASAPSAAPPPPPPPPPPRPHPPAPQTPAAPAPISPDRWRQPVDGACPDGYPVKVAKSGIYHVPAGRSYDRTTPDRCYANAEDAEADGYRRAKA